MLYKLLGWVVWQVGKRWLRRKLPATPALVGAVAVGGAIVVAAVGAARREPSGPAGG